MSEYILFTNSNWYDLALLESGKARDLEEGVEKTLFGTTQGIVHFPIPLQPHIKTLHLFIIDGPLHCET